MEVQEAYQLYGKRRKRARLNPYPLKAALTATESTEFMAGIDYSEISNQTPQGRLFCGTIIIELGCDYLEFPANTSPWNL